MEDVVTAAADYSKLDQRENNVRIRLNSTAVNVENRDGGVDVTYVQNGKTVRVRSLHCTLACYNNIIPHLAPEIDEPQRQALQYPQKVPLLLINVALRNWQAIADSGIGGFYAPSGVLCNMAMDFPVSLGNYKFTNSPNTPAVLQGWGAPGCGQSGTAKEQLNLGRHEIFNTSFDSYEQQILEELNDVWGANGLDVERDVAGLTINRWPHGYAYEYMDLWDSAKYSRGAGPHVIGRQQIGNITIANSDSEAYAYVNAAIDAAHRAVRELTT